MATKWSGRYGPRRPERARTRVAPTNRAAVARGDITTAYCLPGRARGGTGVGSMGGGHPGRGALGVVSVLAVPGGADPYVWLDPVLLQAVVAQVAAALARADPSGTAAYRRGARDFTAELIALDISFRSSLANCSRHDIVTS